MKGLIYCPRCRYLGYKPKVLGRYEGVKGQGTVLLWCKQCGMEIPVNIEEISLK